MKATINIDSDAGTYTHQKGTWSGTFPLADMPKWLAFYREQQARYPAHAQSYEQDVRSLADAARQLKDAVSSAGSGSAS